MASKLYVGGLPFAYTDQDLADLFSEFGEVVSASIVVDKFSNRSRGFGFVEFNTDDEANAAKAKLHESEVGGRRIVVDNARPQAPRD